MGEGDGCKNEVLETGLHVTQIWWAYKWNGGGGYKPKVRGGVNEWLGEGTGGIFFQFILMKNLGIFLQKFTSHWGNFFENLSKNRVLPHTLADNTNITDILGRGVIGWGMGMMEGCHEKRSTCTKANLLHRRKNLLHKKAKNLCCRIGFYNSLFLGKKNWSPPRTVRKYIRCKAPEIFSGGGHPRVGRSTCTWREKIVTWKFFGFFHNLPILGRFLMGIRWNWPPLQIYKEGSPEMQKMPKMQLAYSVPLCSLPSPWLAISKGFQYFRAAKKFWTRKSFFQKN